MRFIAAFLLAGALCSSTVLAAQSSPAAALTEQAGWEAIINGDAEVAAAAFREALAVEPNRAPLHLGAGLAAVLAKQDTDAAASFERALALDPSLTMARVQLALVRYRLRDLNRAIALLEEVVAERPGEVQLNTQLTRWKEERDLHGRMEQAQGSHFSVSFDGPAQEESAKRVVESLERAYWRVGRALDTLLNEPVPVVLYTREQFRDITRSPSWAGGLYDGRIRVPVSGLGDRALAARELAELDRVLAHEFTHALTQSLGGRRVPTWLDEGLATALERGGDPDTTPAVESPESLQAAAARAAASSGPDSTIPLSRLSSGFGNLSDADARAAYATSERAARALLESAGGSAVANLLRDLKDGVRFDSAFERRIQRSFDQFERSLAGSTR